MRKAWKNMAVGAVGVIAIGAGFKVGYDNGFKAGYHAHFDGGIKSLATELCVRGSKALLTAPTNLGKDGKPKDISDETLNILCATDPDARNQVIMKMLLSPGML